MIGRAAVFASVSLLVACNGLTGVGDLHVTGDGGAGGSESRGAGNPGNGGASGVGGVATSAHGPATNGAGPATTGAGPSSTTGVGPSTSAVGPATTTGAGPATTTGAGPSTTTGAGPASVASSVASTGTGGTDPAQICVDFINQKRATIGLGPLARWGAEETCTGDEAHTDADNNQAHSAFGTCGEFAQNECPGWPGPPASMIDNCLQMMWDEGPGTDFSTHGHYINMTNTSYTKVACGFYVLGDGSVWAAQDFSP